MRLWTVIQFHRMDNNNVKATTQAAPQPRPNPKAQKNWDKIVDEELDKFKKEELEKRRAEWKKKEEDEKKNPPPRQTIQTVL